MHSCVDECFVQRQEVARNPLNPEQIDKTGIVIDGPDLNQRKSEYGEDTPIHNQRPYQFNWKARLLIPEPVPGQPEIPGLLVDVPEAPPAPGNITRLPVIDYDPFGDIEVPTTTTVTETTTTTTVLGLDEPPEPGDLGSLTGRAVSDPDCLKARN
jgi:hypothetical protein